MSYQETIFTVSGWLAATMMDTITKHDSRLKLDIPLTPKISIHPPHHLNLLTLTLVRTLAALLMFLLVGSTFAEDAQDAQTPWYEVEAIIFTNDEELGLNSETWPEVVPEIPYDRIINLRFPDDPSVMEERQRLMADMPKPPVAVAAAGTQTKPGTLPAPAPPAKPPEVPFVMLDSSTFQLKDLDQRLRRSRKYNIVLHLCWRQPTLPPDKSIPVYIYSGMTKHPSVSTQPDESLGPVGPSYPELFGTLRLSVSRYLHMQTDLHLRIPRMVKEEVPVAETQSGESSGGFSSFFGVNQSTQPQTQVQEHMEITDFPLQESRRLRSTEVHYFDNPMFGMILTVRPYETNPPPQQ